MKDLRSSLVLGLLAACTISCTGTEDGTVPGDPDSGAPQDSTVGGDGTPPGDGLTPPDGFGDARDARASSGGGEGGDVAPGGDPLDPAKAPPIDTDPSHYPANVWSPPRSPRCSPATRHRRAP
ncbi:MAG: hypothetical protein NVS3B10_14490 [Polyangiales bacterium]